MKKLILIFCFCILLSPKAFADNLYENTLEASGFREVYENSDSEIKNFFKENDIDVFSPDFVSDIKTENLFSSLFSFFKNASKEFGGSILINIFILLIWALYSSFANESTGVNTAFTILSSLCLLAPLINIISSVAAAIKSGGVFMLSFLPVFFGITASSGAVKTAAAGSTALLLACETTVQIIAFLVVPIAYSELCLAISGSISEISPALKLSLALKKGCSFLMTLSFTIFLGFLSVQTAITSAADSLSLKTTKFVVGSFVPVAGSALSETISTLFGGIKILQNGVGVFGIIGVLVVVLPTLCALILWKIGIAFSKITADMLGLSAASKLSEAIGGTLSLLLGVLLFVGALFIISLSVILKVGAV